MRGGKNRNVERTKNKKRREVRNTPPPALQSRIRLKADQKEKNFFFFPFLLLNFEFQITNFKL